MAETIVIKKAYFTNIETAVNAINTFFGSNYQEKNFPVIDDSSDMDPTVARIISDLNSVEPSWIDDPSAIEATINEVLEAAKDVDPSDDEGITELTNNDPTFGDKVNAIIDFFRFKMITDHFQEFGAILNGIHSFELFTTPSKFRSEIELFSRIPMPESIDNILRNSVPVITLQEYVNGLFDSSQIEFPGTMNPETEIERVNQYQPLSESISITTDETVQEAADVNFFKDAKPQHIKFDSKSNKFVLSDQLKKVVDDIISNIKKCDTTKELREYFASEEAIGKKSDSYPNMLASNVLPFVLAKVYNNTSKFPEDVVDVNQLGKFIDSYSSINTKNPGTKRFINYDVFSTFKMDKDGTVDFLKDFLNLNLVNSPNASITNNGLLSCFNIFDSRIYLDTLYNLLPSEEKKDKYATEDSFVKFIRARINKNSRGANPYAEDKAVETPDNEADTEKEVQEAVHIALKQFGNMTPTDMHLCDQFHEVLHQELDLLESRTFSEGFSPLEMGERMYVIQETYKGSIPEYMQTRVKLNDQEVAQTSVTPVSLPPDIPSNPIPDLAGSIDDKVNDTDEYGNLLGSESSHQGDHIVYNITNNYSYNNSFNRETTNKNKKTVTNDHSTGKTENHSKDDHSTGKTINNISKDRFSKNSDKPINNNNNSEDHKDTSEETLQVQKYPADQMQEFATGISIGNLFAFLEDGELSEEPLSAQVGSMDKPRSDLLTAAMDADRNTLSLQQKMKRGVTKATQTGSAILKPVTRTKQWLAGIVDSLVERNEEKVKAEIIENPSYRTALFKAGRLACKLGMFGILFTINGYIGAAYAVAQVSKFHDKERLKKEVQREFGTQIEIFNDQIRMLDQENTPESRVKKWELMRIKSKMESIVADTPKSVFKTSNTIV